MIDKPRVLNLKERSFPSVHYPENIVHYADIRLAAFIAREFWETRKRLGEKKFHKEGLPEWDDRHDEDIKVDIKTFYELLNRDIIK